MSPCGHVVDIETPSSDCAAFTLYVYSNMSAEIHNNMHTDKCMAECFDWKGSSLAFTSDELQVHNACTAAATCHSFQTVPTKTHNTRQVNHEIDGKWTTISRERERERERGEREWRQRDRKNERKREKQSQMVNIWQGILHDVNMPAATSSRLLRTLWI